MARDYRGGTRSGCYALGASNRSDREREELDFYATPASAVERLLVKLKEFNIELPAKLLEPAVGMGHIAQVLKNHGHIIEAIDITDRGWPDTKVQDFLETDSCTSDGIVTNPPYKFATEFVIHSMELLKKDQYCCMLLKIQFMEGNDRAKKLFKNGLNPKYVFVFPDRINCAKQGNFKDNNELFERATANISDEDKAMFDAPESDKGGQVAYMWAVWQKDFKGLTTVDWL